MIHTLALMHRKPGIDRKEFARHYEQVHAPLALRLLPQMRRYARNHIIDCIGREVQFDCISTFSYDSLDAATDVVNFWISDAGRPLRDDEATFLDSSRTEAFIVEERPTQLPERAEGSPLVKTVALLKRKPGLSRREFIDHYERVHAPLIVQHSFGLAGYVRNYVSVPDGAPETDFDVVTELWFQDRDAYERVFRDRETAGGLAVRRDEERFLETDRITFLRVDERVSR